MQKGYLIYEDWEAQKNKAFIDMFIREGTKEGIAFSFVSKADYQNRELPDLVLNRTRDVQVSKWYNKKGILCFHGERITEIGNHKMKTISYLKEHLPKEIAEQQWAPTTWYCSKEQMKKIVYELHRGEIKILQGISLFEEPDTEVVIKSVSGHGGSEVALLPALSQREKFVETMERFCEFDCIFQERIESDSKDVRVYILGNEIYQAVLRQGKDDFRSNYSLGGKVRAYTLSPKEEQWVTCFLEAFRGENIGMAGMDFIIDKDSRLIFNELEEMVGCRMLYQTTDLDIVKDYVAWLKRFVKNNSCHL